MKNLKVLILCAVFGSMIKLNKTLKLSNFFSTTPDQRAEDVIRENQAPSGENPSGLQNSDSNIEAGCANDAFRQDEIRRGPDKTNEGELQSDRPEVPGRVKRQSDDRYPDIKIIRRHRSLNQSQNETQCGLTLENEISERGAKAWPWMAAISSIDSYGQQSIMCGGSIIHQRFILTTATCVTTPNNHLVKSHDILVTLGLTDRRAMTEAQNFTVRAIHIHPGFRIGDPYGYRTYDYDIALLELEKPIEYSSYIRPVCLPPKEIPENSQFYEPLSPAQAIGWGGKKGKITLRPLNKALLKEIDLVIQHPDICKESLRESNLEAMFTDRMFCAAEVRHYTCAGDSGGPAMQSQLSKEGSLIWTQVGIVSWGVGCGLEDEYTFFTHLQTVVPWVDATMDAALKQCHKQ